MGAPSTITQALLGVAAWVRGTRSRDPTGATVESIDTTEQKKRENIHRALYNILDATTRSQTLDALLVRIHDEVKTVMRASNFYVTLYEPASDTYSFIYHVDERDVRQLNVPEVLSGGVTDLVRTTGKPVLKNREDIAALLSEGQVTPYGERSESWLGVPFASGQDVGVVAVQSYTPGNRYTPSDRDALAVISGQIGLAIERKRAEEESEKRKQLLEKILDNVTVGFAINNTATGQVLYVNDAFIRAYRCAREDCASAGGFIQAVYARQEALGQQILRDIASHDPARLVWDDIALTDRTGDTFHVSARNIALPEQQLMISTVMDITAQKQMREQQAALESRLQLTQKMESVGVLAGGIAHDFNNLLTAILGNLDLARDEEDPAERAESLAQASRACIDATDLTRQLLTFAKGGEPVKKVLEIKDLIADTVAFALRGSNVKAEYRFDDEPLTVEVDEGQIKQVIQNLVINAKQAMPAGGTVKIQATHARRLDPASNTEQRIVRIALRDWGCGIAEHDLLRIFEPYFTTKPKGSGTGLGLATAYSIIRRHGGTISVTSRLGEGTSFLVELPACDKEVTGTVGGHAHVVDGRGQRILIMDDEAAIRNLAARMLSKCGYRTEAVPDGAAALNAYAEAMRSHQPFAAVILDVTIPGGMGGRDTIARLKAIDPNVKAVVSSGYSDANESSEYQEQGFVASLQKPYKLQDLASTMAQILSQE